ncbi:TPA: hypothetical protein DCR49_02395 [Candidatus Delongbacteria bacterium]|nr:MAG: hypothetical protein A2Y39_05805 [Candidatus Delongbacteria bacterium GWF2_40_14]HAQ60844.1 hypothetical protein [Candidatus Delongbacteria bacterium]
MDNVRIELTNNNGFKWHESNGIQFKGYIFDDGKYITGYEAVDYIRIRFQNGIPKKEYLKEFNGIFAFILTLNEEIFICADRTRSFPLFYTKADSLIRISDDPKNLRKDDSQVNAEAAKVFLHTGYTTGSSTLFKDIFQIQAGEFITVSGLEISKEFYHFYESDKISDDAVSLELELCGIIDSIGDDLAVSLKDKTPVIPLSSGFDSRLIAAMLKKRGFDNVITFTYGRKNNPELELSEKVARKLGYSWRYIEYSEETVKDFIVSDRFRDYYPAASNYSSMFYLQEYFALEELKRSIPENSVFIPGHSGDFFAGSHLNKRIISAVWEDEIIDEIMNKHYGNKNIIKCDLENIKYSIIQSLNPKDMFSYLDFENWDLKERQAKFILNSNRIYEYFGYEYRLPLMDSRLMDFFTRVSPGLKYGKKFYDKVLKEKYFNSLGLNFENETNPSVKILEKQDKKNSLKKIIPKKIINFYKENIKKNNDIYYNIGVTEQMIDDLLNSGEEIDNTGENRNSIIIQWYLHQIRNNKI